MVEISKKSYYKFGGLGNPKLRRTRYPNGKPRYWYTGVGVMCWSNANFRNARK